MQLVCFLRLANVFLIVFSSNMPITSAMYVPRSSVVLTGDKVEMNCSATGSGLTTWTYMYTSWNTSTERDIYSGVDIFDSIKSRYKIDKRISGQHNLIIDSVDLAHAGRYECTSGIQKTLRADIQLIVLGSHPVCAANISATQNDGRERNHLSIWCSISYAGNGNPVFSWTKDNTHTNIAANTTFSSSRGPFTTTSLIMQQLLATDRGVAIQCKITFENPIISERVYVPVYTWNYTLPYGPMNLRIVEYEGHLECSADGDPAPTYRWARIDTKSSREGPMILLDDNNQTFQCTATNVFGSERKNFTITKGSSNVINDSAFVYNLHGNTNERSVMIHSVGLVVLSSVLIVFGIFLLLVGLKLRKLSSASDEDKTSTNASSFPPHQPSKKLNSPQPTDEYAEIERADATDNTYCALEKQPTAAQKTEVYCELRPIDKRNSKQSSKQRAENKDR